MGLDRAADLLESEMPAKEVTGSTRKYYKRLAMAEALEQAAGNLLLNWTHDPFEIQAGRALSQQLTKKAEKIRDRAALDRND